MLKVLILSMALALGACGTTGGSAPGVPPTAAETQVSFEAGLTRATLVVNEVTVTANALYKAKILKQQDAENTLLAVKAARDGLAVARTMDASQGLSKVNMTLAILGGTQIYLATLSGAQK